MNREEFVKTINDLRRKNKGKWYYWTGTVNNQPVEIKAYDTWLQIFRISGIQQNTLMDIPVNNFLVKLSASIPD